MVQRIAFWLLGAALFVAIALMPNLLMAWFYTGGRVHAIVLPTIVVLIALLWGSSKAARASH